MFGSGLKDALFDAKIENATLKLELKAALRDAEYHETNVVALSENLRIQADRANEAEKKNAVLMERLDLLANHLPEPKAFSFPEEAEDAQWDMYQGRITPTDFEKILESTGALNTEVDLDYETSDYPRLSAVT